MSYGKHINFALDRFAERKIFYPVLQGSPPNLFHPKCYFLCDLKPHAKFQKPTITPSGRKEREQNGVNSGHLDNEDEKGKCNQKYYVLCSFNFTTLSHSASNVFICFLSFFPSSLLFHLIPLLPSLLHSSTLFKKYRKR